MLVGFIKWLFSRRRELPDDVLFVDSSQEVPVYVTRNGVRMVGSVKELRDEELAFWEKRDE